MHPGPASRRFRVPVWLAVSALAHGAFVLVALETKLGLMAGGKPAVVARSSGSDGMTDFDPACLLEEALNAAARASICLVPGAAPGGDRAACFGGAARSLETGRLACVSAAAPMEITMIDLPSYQTDMEKDAQKKIDELYEEAQKDEEKWDDASKVVDIAPPEVEVRPENAKLLGEYDSKVEKETVRKGEPVPSGSGTTGKDPRILHSSTSNPADADAQGGRPGAPGSAAAVSREKSAVGSGTIASSESEKGAAQGFESEPGGNAVKRGKGLGVAIDPLPGTTPGGEAGDGKTKADLRPSGDALAKATSGTYDDLDDIDEGNDTLLNTKRFKYASFFNRVKRAVWENWHADRVYGMRDPDGKIYGVKDRLTVLKVSLKPDGSLANVIVEKPSGVDFLDDEAVSAFRKASPFPNPPKGLVDQESKLITFRFGFTLEIQDRPSWKIVRYQ